MTHEEAQLLLDSMLAPVNFRKRSTNKDDALSDKDKADLLNIVIALEAQKASSSINSIVMVHVQTVANIIKNGGYTGNKQNEAFPFLIKQVLFYLACCSLINGGTQADIINEFVRIGIPLHHNFFTKLGQTPTAYLKTLEYHQPENPMPYMGQKKGELAVAIKNLSYQAGSYSYYLDIFGGSGSASTAIPILGKVTQKYSEINKKTHRLFYTLQNKENCKYIINEINKIRHYILCDGDYLDSKFAGSSFNVAQEIDIYQMNNVNKDDSGNFSTLAQITLKDLNHDKSIIDIMSFVYYFLPKVEDDFILNIPVFYYCENGKYKQKSVSFSKAKLMGLFRGLGVQDISQIAYEDFLPNRQVIYRLICKLKQTAVSWTENDKFYTSYPNLSILNKDDSRDVQSLIEEHIQARFFRVFLYCVNHRKDKNIGDADYYVMFWYVYKLQTRNKNIEDIGLSEFYRIALHESSGTEDGSKKVGESQRSKKPWRFLEVNFEPIFIDFYERIKNIEASQGSYTALLHQYASNKNALVYSDSPYVATMDYNTEGVSEDSSDSSDTSDKVPRFTTDDMSNLIETLVRGDYRFIFSCRAAYNKNSSKNDIHIVNPIEIYDKSDKFNNLADIPSKDKKGKVEKMESNYLIQSKLFYKFDKEARITGTDLYVLAIMPNGKTLLKALSTKDEPEIMITNYEIKPFKDANNSCNYEVYTFEEFLAILMQVNLGNINLDAYAEQLQETLSNEFAELKVVDEQLNTAAKVYKTVKQRNAQIQKSQKKKP